MLSSRPTIIILMEWGKSWITKLGQGVLTRARKAAGSTRIQFRKTTLKDSENEWNNFVLKLALLAHLSFILSKH